MKKSASTVIFALVFAAVVVAVGYASLGLVPSLVFFSALMGGFLLWVFAKTNAPFASVKIPYLVVFGLFLLHLAEEYIFGFDHALSELTGVAIPAAAFPVILVVAPSVWLLGFFLLSRGFAFGYFLAWVLFFAMGVSELTHYILPIFAGEQYGYFPGMVSVTLLAPAAWFGMWRLFTGGVQEKWNPSKK